MLSKYLISAGVGLVVIFLIAFTILQYGNSRESVGYQKGYTEGNAEAIQAANESSQRLERISNEVRSLEDSELDNVAASLNIMRTD